MDSWADGVRRDIYRQWAEARQPEVDRGSPWTMMDYVKNPGNTIMRGVTEVGADVFDASHMNEDPDAVRAELLRKSMMSDKQARSSWDILASQGLLKGR